MTADDIATVREALKQGCAEHLRHHALLPEWAAESDAALARVEAENTRLLETLVNLLARSETGPLNVDISDYGDEWCHGFLAGQRNALEELDAALSGEAP